MAMHACGCECHTICNKFPQGQTGDGVNRIYCEERCVQLFGQGDLLSEG